MAHVFKLSFRLLAPGASGKSVGHGIFLLRSGARFESLECRPWPRIRAYASKALSKLRLQALSLGLILSHIDAGKLEDASGVLRFLVSRLIVKALSSSHIL